MLEFTEPLSQVVFVEDYFQLVFQEQRLSVFSRATVSKAGAATQQGEPGFCDALVQLIGQQADLTSSEEPFVLTLAFESGTKVQVYADGNGPEAFSVHDEYGRFIVGRGA